MVYFTHIPKTAGTSMRKAVLEPAVDDGMVRRFQGVQEFVMNRESFDLLTGHGPYGVHRFAGKGRYFVMLRDPVDRALSHYYFIRACNSESYKHPSLDDATQHDLVDFYRQPAYQNMQTRYVAGVAYYVLMRHAQPAIIQRRALAAAQHNLRKNYTAVGLTEAFDRSAAYFAECLGVTIQPLERQHKRTPSRPRRQDLDAHTLDALTELNALDVALYQTAREVFARQG